MVYDVTITVMGIIHGLTGVAWMGVHISNELFVIPELKKAQKLGDAPMLRNMKKLSMVGMVLGMLTLLTGIIFMFVKWGFDFSIYSQPEPRTVVVALVIVVVVIALGMAFLRPIGMKIGKAAAGMKPTDELTPDFKADLNRVASVAGITSKLVGLAFIMMILAINGGI